MVWTYARTILRHFGDRVKMRLDVAITCAVAVVLVLMGVMLVLVLMGTDYTYGGAGPGMAMHEYSQLSSPLVQQALIAILTTGGCVLLAVAKGSRVNERFSMHR
jgi:ABC-type spermidine/putrescine transport system permease subunit I